MKTEFLKSLGLDEDTIGKIQAENGKDVQAEKNKAAIIKERADKVEAELSDLKKKSGDNATLQKKLDELIAEQEKRQEEEKKAAELKALNERFNAVAEKTEFVNELTKKGIFDEFRSELGKDEHKGKGDVEIFSSIIKDRDGILKNPNPAADIPGAGHNSGQKNTSSFFETIKQNQTIKRSN